MSVQSQAPRMDGNRPSAPVLLEVRTRISVLLCGALVLLLAVATYVAWLSNYFVADDWGMINLISKPGWSLADLLPYRQVAYRLNGTIHYAPVHIAYLWLTYQAGGISPERYHLFLLLVHMVATLSLFGAALQLTGRLVTATIAASIFAVHFGNTEPIGWLGGGAHAVGGTLGAVALALYARYLVTRRRRWWVGGLLALLAASVTQVGSLPWFAILACLDIFYSRGTGSPRGVGVRLATLGGLLLVVMTTHLPALQFGGGVYQYRFGAWVVRNLFFYPVSTIIPGLQGASLSLTRDLLLATNDHEAFIRLVGMADAFGMLLAAGLAAVAVALLWALGGWLGRFSVTAFFLAITPFLLLDGHGYRYMYAPLIFFSLAAASAVVGLYRQLRPRAFAAGLAVLAVVPLFVLLSFAESQRELFWWQQAGFVSHRTLQQLQAMQPRFPPGAKILFGGLPDTLGETDAVVWRNGIDGAVDVLYRDSTLKVEAYTRAEVERMFREELRGAPNHYGFVWADWQLKQIAP